MKNLLIEDNTSDGSKLDHYPECVKGPNREPKILRLNPSGFGLQIKTKMGMAIIFPNGKGITWQDDFDYNGVKYKKNTNLLYKCQSDKLTITLKTQDPTSDLPDWVPNCLKNNFPDLKTISGGEVKSEFYGDDFSFFKTQNYFRVKTSTDTYDGNWKCVGDKTVINTDDGDEWNTVVSLGWKGVPIPAPTVDCSPFKDKDQSDKFRKWVNDNLPEIAENIPGLDANISDKKLSIKGKCNSVHIQTAANHEIDGKTLLDIFTSGIDITKIQQEKNDREEVYNWWDQQIKGNKVSGGKLVLFPPDSRYYKNYYAYRKEDQKDNNLFYFFLKDGTWFSYYKGKGYQEEGKWKSELGESKNISLIRNLKKQINEQIIVGSETKKHPSYQPEDSSNLSVKDDDQKNDQKNDQNLKSDTPKEMSLLQKDKESELVIAGYEKIPNCDAYDPDRLIEKINLKEKYPNLFDDDVCYVKYRELSQDSWNTFLTDSSETGFSALTKNVQGYKGKENCRTVISNTYDAQKNNLLTNNKFILKKVKDFIDNDCHRLYKDKFERRTNNKLEWLVYNSAAFRQLNESTIKKNMKNTLNNNIKKHLKETIEVKKTNLVENRIIKSRLELTTSNSSNINLTVNRMITESVKMRVVGMDNNLIKENLMDLIDVLYKDKSTKVKKVFNQESAKYISDKIGLSEGAFLRRVINDVFSNNSIEKTIELFNNCDYLCNIISDEVSKTLGFSDNTVEDIFSKNMKPEFKSMICPIINSIGDKMENQFNKMKSKALDKS